MRSILEVGSKRQLYFLCSITIAPKNTTTTIAMITTVIAVSIRFSPPFFSFFGPEVPVYGWNVMADRYIANTRAAFCGRRVLSFPVPCKTAARESSEMYRAKANQTKDAIAR